MTFKMLALLLASQQDVFSTPYFCWLDLGCSHVAPDNYEEAITKILVSPREKISACSIHYRGEAELEDSSTYCNAGHCGLAGTILTTDKMHLMNLYPRYMRILYEHVEKGIWYSDEQILTYCYYRHPDLFNIYYGDYSSVLLNYHGIKGDWESIDRFLIKEAIKIGDFTQAKEIATKAKEAIDSGDLIVSSDDKTYLTYIIQGSISFK